MGRNLSKMGRNLFKMGRNLCGTKSVKNGTKSVKNGTKSVWDEICQNSTWDEICLGRNLPHSLLLQVNVEKARTMCSTTSPQHESTWWVGDRGQYNTWSKSKRFREIPCFFKFSVNLSVKFGVFYVNCALKLTENFL